MLRVAWEHQVILLRLSIEPFQLCPAIVQTAYPSVLQTDQPSGGQEAVLTLETGSSPKLHILRSANVDSNILRNRPNQEVPKYTVGKAWSARDEIPHFRVIAYTKLPFQPVSLFPLQTRHCLCTNARSLTRQSWVEQWQTEALPLRLERAFRGSQASQDLWPKFTQY